METSLRNKAETLEIIDKLRYSSCYQSKDEVNADIDKLRKLVEKM